MFYKEKNGKFTVSRFMPNEQKIYLYLLFSIISIHIYYIERSMKQFESGKEEADKEYEDAAADKYGGVFDVE